MPSIVWQTKMQKWLALQFVIKASVKLNMMDLNSVLFGLKWSTSIDNSNRYFILSFIFIGALKSDIIECKGHHSVLLSMCFLYVHCFKYNAFSKMWFRKSTVMGKFYCSFYHYLYLSNFISASINPLPSYFKGIHLKVLMLISMPSLFLFVTIFCCLHFQKE